VLHLSKIVVSGFALGLLAVAGCGPTDTRLTNQGGGSLITAGLKVAEGNMCGLTADEWQIMADNAPSLAQQYGVQINGEIPQLTDEQAQGLVDYCTAHNLCTIEAIVNAVETTTEVPPELAALFE